MGMNAQNIHHNYLSLKINVMNFHPLTLRFERKSFFFNVFSSFLEMTVLIRYTVAVNSAMVEQALSLRNVLKPTSTYLVLNLLHCHQTQMASSCQTCYHFLSFAWPPFCNQIWYEQVKKDKVGNCQNFLYISTKGVIDISINSGSCK